MSISSVLNTGAQTPSFTNIGNFSDQKLIALWKMVCKEKNRREKEVLEQYGISLITMAGGMESFLKIRTVEAKTLNLHCVGVKETKYYECKAMPKHMENDSIVKGILPEGNRPFIAVKINMTDPKTNKIVTAVEVIFRRSRSDEDNIVTTLRMWGSDNKQYDSTLYTGGRMSKKQRDAACDIIQGKRVKSLGCEEGKYFVQLAS